MSNDINIKDAAGVTTPVRTIDKADGLGERQAVIIDWGGSGPENLGGVSTIIGVEGTGLTSTLPAGASGQLGYQRAILDKLSGSVTVVTGRALKHVEVDLTSLTTATTAYVAGDIISTPFTLANAASASGGSGVIRRVNLVDPSKVLGETTLYLFNGDATLSFIDNAAFLPVTVDQRKIKGRIDIDSPETFSSSYLATSLTVDVPYTLNGVSTLKGALMTREVPSGFFGAAGLNHVYLEIEYEWV